MALTGVSIEPMGNPGAGWPCAELPCLGASRPGLCTYQSLVIAFGLSRDREQFWVPLETISGEGHICEPPTDNCPGC